MAPFQLAFLLTVMVSAVREDDDFRDVLDLIWFPTGGGKTEAYLGLIAFLIVWRRLKYPDSGGGTTAFMRYTLRLLTRQQFERAARMVCALELIRRRNPARLGEAPVDIVRGPDSLMVVQDIRTWDRRGRDPLEREIRYVDRVRSALGIGEVLCTPPRSAERDGTVIGWIPALRFPTWMRCLTCGLLHRAPWRRQRAKGGGGRDTETGSTGGAAETGECVECGGRLEQAPWVLVHEDGYLADVPWHALAHRDSRHPEQRQCHPDWTQPNLKLSEIGADRRIHCSLCGSNATFPSGALPRIPFPPRTWQQPWMREPPAQSPEPPALLLEINDVRVHTASTRTALVIPPESRIRRGTVTDRLYGSTRSQLSIRDARNPLARRSAIKRLASEYRCASDEIEDAIAEIDSGYPLFGRAIREGIFFTLDEALLQRWEGNDALHERADAFSQRYVQRAGQGIPELDVDVSPRFLLCHTLAHLMIHELDAEAGYPAASLKERIYCETGKSGKGPMAGILIYVAVPDEAASWSSMRRHAKGSSSTRWSSRTSTSIASGAGTRTSPSVFSTSWSRGPGSRCSCS